MLRKGIEMKRPYTTRDDKTEFSFSLNSGGKGWKIAKGNVSESLKNLAADLPKVPDNISFNRNDISVPSPWAAMISFDIILKDKSNEFGALKTAATNEWRSILTLIALRKIYDYKLEYKEIELSSDNVYDNEFYENILNLAPKTTLFKNSNSWKKFVFIMLEGKTIAVFSDSALVTPICNLEESNATKKLREIGLMDKNMKYINPVEFFKNDVALSIYMKKWLEEVKKNIPEKSRTDRTSAVIDEFIEELREKSTADKNIFDDLSDENCGFLKFLLDLDGREPENAYELLWYTNVDMMDLDIAQVKSKTRVGKLNTPVYILEGLGKNLVKLIDLLGEKCNKPDGTLWDNSKVFLDRLSVVKYYNDKRAYADDELNCTMRSDDREKEEEKYSLILPIREEVLQSLPSEAIRETIVRQETDESIQITLNFELENGDKCPLSRSFKKSECIKLSNQDLPMVAIWPYMTVKSESDASINRWKDYYVFTVCENTLKRPYSTFVKCDGDEEQLEYTPMTKINKTYERNVARSRKLPSYLSIFKNTYSYSNELTNSENIGIIILPKPKINAKTLPNREYIVGFDFGTTSTAAFCKSKREEVEGDAKDRFIKLGKMKKTYNDGNLHYKETVAENISECAGDDDDGCFVAYNNFLIGELKNEPKLSFVPGEYPARKSYMSIYKRNTDDTIVSIVSNESLRYGNIIFDQSYLRLVSDYVSRNLKWGKDQQEQISLTGYINQIMKSIAVTVIKNEYVGSIKWRISYPTSLSKNALNTYKKITGDVIKYIDDNFGIKSSLDDVVQYCSESIVSAKFKSNCTGDYICIDIGGGSTDVSLWKRSFAGQAMENVMQFSVGIASRKIFLAGLADAVINPWDIREKNNSDISPIQEMFIKILKNNDPDGDNSGIFYEVRDRIKECGKSDIKSITRAMEKFAHAVEPMLQTDGETIKKQVQSIGPVGERLERFLIYGFWGILYYTALSVAKYKDKLNDTQKITVCLAGNGSMIYEWLSDETKESLIDSFETVLNRHIGREENPIRVDRNFDYAREDLKTEAARGLLAIKSAEDYKSCAMNDSLINGSKCTVTFKNSGEIHSFNVMDLINDEEHEDFSNFFENSECSKIHDIKVDNPMEDLNEYINIMNKNLLERYNPFPEIDEAALKDRICETIDLNRKNSTVAPVFILELEALLRTVLGY